MALQGCGSSVNTVFYKLEFYDILEKRLLCVKAISHGSRFACEENRRKKV